MYALSAHGREEFPVGRALARHLTGTSQMVAANALLADGALPDGGAILTLPQFAICRFADAESINRVQWDGGHTVRLLEYGQRAEFAWKIEDSSLPTVSGTLLVEVDSTGELVLIGDAPTTPGGTAPALHSANTRADLERTLKRISESGSHDTFGLMAMLIPYTRRSVMSAAHRVYREIHGLPDDSGGPVIDAIESETVISRIVYGDDGSDSSVVTRLLRRCAVTDITVRKSTMNVIAWAIWSSAETAVRNTIGDPHAGRVIRRIARLINSTDPDEVLAAYRSAYPNARMGVSRVHAALTANATVSARSDTRGATG